MGRERSRAMLLSTPVIAVPVLLAGLPAYAPVLLALPLLTARSLLRMSFAYLLSLVFSYFVGYAAATRRRAEAVIVPLLDVFQSIPILGFMPAALLLFSAFLPQTLGNEIASIFLIFTSMTWNMTFGIYESITSIPHDLQDAVEAFGVTSRLRVRRLLIPSTIPRVVYNSILSWTNGWFFLVASEILISTGTSIPLPGLGSFLGQAAGLGASQNIDYGNMILGLLALVLTVLAIDVLLWRPLQVWSDRFKVEATAAAEAPRSRTTIPYWVRLIPTAYVRLRWLPTFPAIRRVFRGALLPLSRAYARVSSGYEGFYHRHNKAFQLLGWVDLALLAVVGVWLAALGIQRTWGALAENPPPELPSLPLALALSTLRLAAAYFLVLAWTIPGAYLASRSARAQALLTPLFEMSASVPAPAILPVLAGLVLGLGGGANTMAVVVTVFAMQWYLLFNLLGAFRAIPGDIREATLAFGVGGWLKWKRVLLPAIFPSLVTGSITAWGAGWNALIVSEYIRYQGRLYGALGLGFLLDKGTFTTDPSGPGLIFLSVITMTVAVIALNHALWKPLYRIAASRFRIEA